MRAATSRRSGVVPLTAAVLIIAAACAGSDDDSAPPSDATPETDAPSPVAADTPTATLPPSATSTGDGVDSVPAPDVSSAAPTTTTPEADFLPELVEGPCGGDPFENRDGVRCGTVAVPLDHADPTGPTIEIAVAQVSPIGDQLLTTDPVLRLQGGPGGGITDAVGGWADGDARERFGVVLIEYRGEPNSDPALVCDEKWAALVENLGVSDPFPAEADRIADAGERCAERAATDGIDVSRFDTPAIADDIELVRRALDVDRWNLIGISYGTTTAMEVMRRHPDSVRSAILDSVYPPERSTIADVEGGLDHLLAVFDDTCPPGSGCNPTDEAFSDRFRAITAALDENPAVTTLTDPITGEPFDALLDGGDFANAAWLAVWSGNVPDLVAGAVASDDPAAWTSAMQVVLDIFVADYGDSSLLMADAVECRDRGGALGRDAIDAAAVERPEFSSVFQYATYVGHGITCDRLDVGTIEGWTDPLVSDLPTLVVAGRWDAVTPPAWGEALLDGLPNGRFFEYPGLAHGTYAVTDCSESISHQFLADPTGEIDSSCIAAMTDHFSDRYEELVDS